MVVVFFMLSYKSVILLIISLKESPFLGVADKTLLSSKYFTDSYNKTNGKFTHLQTCR